jgi:hypothetical protein
VTLLLLGAAGCLSQQARPTGEGEGSEGEGEGSEGEGEGEGSEGEGSEGEGEGSEGEGEGSEGEGSEGEGEGSEGEGSEGEGEGENICPLAVAQARTGSNEWGKYPDDAHPLVGHRHEAVSLTGVTSSDPDGEVWEWHWTLAERPPGSTAGLSDPDRSGVNLWLDAVGRYVLLLTVVDDGGLASCNQGRVVIEAEGERGLRVALTWHTPEDEDETDHGFSAGSDLDLHLLHPLGEWFDEPYDCFYGNSSPDWGRSADLGDDPRLEIDDTDGAGPELILFPAPEANRSYRVGVHYSNDFGFGASIATVKVYVDGEPSFERARRLPGSDYFWIVAEVAWPGGQVTTIDELLDQTPD